ncbi:hypothetical protein EON62_01155 [archaeon]|nr:MAG: hypothetical protein EON62_01155 [archaeon]
MQIAAAERVTIAPEALDVLIEAAGGDFRQCLNSLQMMATTQRSLSTRDVQNRIDAVRTRRTRRTPKLHVP